MNNQHPTHDSNQIPQDLRQIAQQIDALGAAHRATPGRDFEAAIHAATVGSLVAPPLRLHNEAAVPTVRRFTFPLRVAAAVALVSTVALSYLAINGRVRPQNIVLATTDTGATLDEIDLWLTLSATEDTVDAELDVLKADTQSLSEGVHALPTLEGGAL